MGANEELSASTDAVSGITDSRLDTEDILTADAAMADELADEKILWGTDKPGLETATPIEPNTSEINEADESLRDASKENHRGRVALSTLAGVLFAAGVIAGYDTLSKSGKSTSATDVASAPDATAPKSRATVVLAAPETTVTTVTPATTPETTTPVTEPKPKPTTTTTRPKPRTTTTKPAPIVGPASVTAVSEKTIVMAPGSIYHAWDNFEPPLRFKFVKFGTEITVGTSSTAVKDCSVYIGLEKQVAKDKVEEVRTYKKKIADCNEPLANYSKLSAVEVINMPGLEQIK